MTNKLNVTRTICGLCALFFTLLVSSPLALLALNYEMNPAVSTTSTVNSNDNLQKATPKPDQPDAIYLTDTVESIPSENLPVYDTLTFRERRQRNLPTALPSSKYYYGNKTVYLTFDDGPDDENTPIILDVLKKHNVKATFFVVGTIVEKNPELLKRIFLEGHSIGNHSYNHEYAELYQSADSYCTQLHKNDEVINSVIGVRPRITRAPGGTVGSFTKSYWDLLKLDGYVDIGWNISSGDAAGRRVSAKQIISNITYQMQNKALWSHSIVLMHDGAGHSETAKALPQIIKLYKDQGFEFRVVNTETPPAW